ncbi:hypothetical protein ACLB2K_039707 [Fragaria x ananassa]
MMKLMANCRATRGMPFLHFTPLLALFHSLHTKPSKSRETHLGNRPLEPRVSNVEDALKVFDEMLHRRPLPSVIPFNQILTQLVKLKQFEAVLSLKRQLGLSGIASDAYTLAIIINCYCHLNQMEYALSVLVHFFKLGLQPDVATFTTLIHGFVLQNRVSDAARLFRKMVEGGHCQADVVTFNTLIKGFCAIGNNTTAIQLLRKMDERGCQPNRVTYSSIIHSLSKDTLLDEAKNLFLEMIGRGIAPDVFTYTSLIKGVCNIGHWKEATRLLYEMASQGLCKAGEVQSAKDLFCGLSPKGVQPNVWTYTIMISGLCKAGLLVEAEELLREMEQKGCSPDDCTYNTIIRGFINNNETSRATSLIEEMCERGFSGDASTMELIVDLLSKDKVDPVLLAWLKDSAEVK